MSSEHIHEEYEGTGGSTLRKAISSLNGQLNSGHRRKMLALMIMIFISAILDVFGLAAILPLIQIATNAGPNNHRNKYLQDVFDFFHFQNDKSFLLFLILSVFVFFVIKTVFGFFVNYLQTRFSGVIANHITRRQFNKYFNLDFHSFTTLKSSSITQHIFNTPLSYTNWVVLPLIMLASELLIVLLIVGGIAAYDIKLFMFIAVIVGPCTWLIYYVLKNRSSRVGAEMNKIYPLSLGTLTQTIGGYIDIKLADKEIHYRDKFLKFQRRYQNLEMTSYLYNLVPMRANELVALSGVVLIFVYAIFLTDNSSQAIVMVSLFAAAAYRLMPSLNRIVSSMVYLRRNMSSMAILEMYSDLVYDRKDEGPGEPVTFKNTIALKNLCFHFPEKQHNVLQDINIEIRKGEKIGIIGSSGSGKTTLMNVLLRFYEEQKGNILIDGLPLRVEQRREWRSMIGYVKQDIYLMDATIQENITFGDEIIDKDRLNLAVSQASLGSLIASLPDGLNTTIGERGSRLSGGQRQRISIARSLYRNAEILIFDEATSALDNQTEQEVSESIDSLSDVHKTIFIIAHRITTLRNCDRIYELKDGRVDGIYSYSELVEKVV